MPDLQEAQRVLILDLASDNPITERSIEPFLPESPNRRVYRVTSFGAVATPAGQTAGQHAWRAWTDAVDRMLEKMRGDLGDDREIAHFYVAGRAGLPIFAYLGLRLGKQARVTAINQRPTGQWDMIPLQNDPRSPDSTASGCFFDDIKGLARGLVSEATGKVAVFVSSQRDSEPTRIREFARGLGVPLAGIVTLRSRPGECSVTARSWLGSSEGPRAAAELDEYFTAINDCYPSHEGLMVFIAGPAPLALMVGWAINPRIYTPVWLPSFNRAAYETAVEIPWPLVSGGKPRILLATANPPGANGPNLDIESELKGILTILDQEIGQGRCEYRILHAVQIDNLMDTVREFQPHILHFSGHSDAGGSYLRSEDGKEEFIRMHDLQQILASTATELRLLVLCSCRSADQARALTAVAPFTVGTTAPVLDYAAIAFSRQFYAALTHGNSVKTAFAQGKSRADVTSSGNTCEFQLCQRDGMDPGREVLFSPVGQVS